MNFISQCHPKWPFAVVLVCLLWLPVFPYAQDPAPFEITIEPAHDAMPGHAVTTDIVCNGVSALISGFEFLIFVDSDTLGFVDVQPGEFINRCGWQYFTYRYYEAFNIGINTHTDAVKIVAAAQSNTGSGTPDCYLPNEGESLVQLTLKIRPGCGFRCLQSPVRFVWTDCQSNHLTLNSDGSLAVSRFVYDYSGHDIIDITDTNCIFPSMGGSPECCLDNTPPEENRSIDFYNGIVSTGCPDDICFDRGDLNCNGIPYEASDIVFYIRMFIHLLSPSLPPYWNECSEINSDVNADGIELSIADLVYLFRVVANELLPYLKPNPTIQTMDIYSHWTPAGTEICYRSPVDIGGLLIRFDGTETPVSPIFGSPTGDMDVEYVSGQSRLGVFIYDEAGDVIPAGEGVLFTIPGTKTPILSYVDAADWSGQILTVKAELLPDKFEVSQNRPNPFNPTTTIMLSLPQSTDWRIEIFNIVGQSVRGFSGYDNAGEVSVLWDGCDQSGKAVASGVYFYRATVGNQSLTRKMSLMK